jgi:hypothetical protein
LLMGSDLVTGRYDQRKDGQMGKGHANSLPNIGPDKAIAYYVDNYKQIGPIVKGVADRTEGRMHLYFNPEAYAKYIRMMYGSKMAKQLK